MNPKVKRKWLKALRSGEYLQGTGQLCLDPDDPWDEGRKDGNFSFCCLGVLTNLYYLEKGEEFPKIEWGNGGLSRKVQEWAELTDHSIEYKPGSGKKAVTPNMDTLMALDLLAEWNDSGKRFKTIANWIEREL